MRLRRLGLAAAHAAVTFLIFAAAELAGIFLAYGLFTALERRHQPDLVDPTVLIGLGAASAGALFGLGFTWLARWGRDIRPRYSYVAVAICIAGAAWTAFVPLLPLWILPFDRPPPAFLHTLWWAIVSGVVYRAGIALFFCLAIRRIIIAPLPLWPTVSCFVVGVLMLPLSWGLSYLTMSQIGDWPLPALAVAIMAGIVRFALPPARTMAT